MSENKYFFLYSQRYIWADCNLFILKTHQVKIAKTIAAMSGQKNLTNLFSGKMFAAWKNNRMNKQYFNNDKYPEFKYVFFVKKEEK